MSTILDFIKKVYKKFTGHNFCPIFINIFIGIIVWNCCSQDESMDHSEGPTSLRPEGVAKCDDVEVKRPFQNVVTAMVAVPELDEAIKKRQTLRN